MSKLTVEQYEQLVRRCRLVEPAQLDKVWTELVRKFDGVEFDAETLAERLIEQRLITLWHHNILTEGKHESVLGGRHRGFFLGSYKLLDHLGTGGMNSVFLAEHVVMKRRVAIKVLPITGEEDPSFLERFRFESRAIAALDHPNIVRAHDFNSDGDVYYLVMEYVEGKDLHQLVKEKGPLPFKAAADFIRQAAEGLTHAHKAGLVHRDIKPANLLVDHKKTIKLLDLGVSRLDVEDDEGASRGHCHGIVGTADYLAPEQAIDSHKVDGRADIYSLGCTLYFLLTGHPPFPKGTIAQRMIMHQMQEPAGILEDRPNAPIGLVEICRRMMAKKPEDRPADAAEVGRLLVEWTKSYTQSADDPQGTGNRPSGPSGDTFATVAPTTTMGGKKKKKGQTQQVQGDEKIVCRTCGTNFGKYMYRSKCPKCGTVNHPLAAYGSQADYGSRTAGDTASGGTNSGEAHQNTSPALPPTTQASGPQSAGAPASTRGPGSAPGGGHPAIRAVCTKCCATFASPWEKCLICGGDTVPCDGQLPPTGPTADGASAPASRWGEALKQVQPGAFPFAGTPQGAEWDRTVGPPEEVGAGVAAFSATDGDHPFAAGTALAWDRASRSEGSSLQVIPTPFEEGTGHQEVVGADGNWGSFSAVSGEMQLEEAPGSHWGTQQPFGKQPLSTLGAHRGSTEEGSVSASRSSQGSRSRSSDASSSGRERSSSSLKRHGAAAKAGRRKPLLGIALVGGMIVALALAFVAWRAGSDGSVQERFPNGRKKTEGLLAEGLRHGRWIEWYADGQKQREGEYERGVPVGRWIEWSPTGQIVSEGNYLAGKADGAWTYRFPDGQIEKQGNFRDGDFVGRWVFWHRNGQRKAEVEYRDGNRTELAKWNERGEPLHAAADPLDSYAPLRFSPR